jgi:hypothetical protein
MIRGINVPLVWWIQEQVAFTIWRPMATNHCLSKENLGSRHSGNHNGSGPNPSSCGILCHGHEA